MKRIHARMYHREGRGWYGDFRNYAREGGGREALKPDGARRPTHDQAHATLLFARRLEELQARRDGRLPAPSTREPVPTLAEYLDRHGALKALDGRARAETIARERVKLELIAEWWGDPRLDVITARHFNDLKLQLKGRAAQTVCHYVNAVSSLLQNAVSDGHLPANPAQTVKRPRVNRGEVPYLESAEGHRLIVAAGELDHDRSHRGFRLMRGLVATALLTGVRKSELLALLVGDVDFDAGYIHVRPNPYYPQRKSRHAIRRVPLWPQLRDVLVPIVGEREGGLLFSRNGKPVRDPHKGLMLVFERAGISKPDGKEWHLFRHTYTAMRLQTLDNGAPVSPWTVKTELGHGSLTLIENTYGHLLEVRDRLPVVEYRPLEVVREAARTA